MSRAQAEKREAVARGDEMWDEARQWREKFQDLDLRTRRRDDMQQSAMQDMAKQEQVMEALRKSLDESSRALETERKQCVDLRDQLGLVQAEARHLRVRGRAALACAVTRTLLLLHAGGSGGGEWSARRTAQATACEHRPR